MPTDGEILAQLTQQANAAHAVGLFWHLASIAGLVLLLAASWRPPQSVAALLSLAPLVTAGAISFLFSSPFNSVVLGLVVFGTLVLAANLPVAPLTFASRGFAAAGVAAIAYAFVYPHFVTIHGWRDIFFTPMGVVPCPSLALVLGATLLAGGFGSRAFSLTLAGAGLFYALFGMFRLGVWLDAGLLAVSVALAVQAWRIHPVIAAPGLPLGVR